MIESASVRSFVGHVVCVNGVRTQSWYGMSSWSVTLVGTATLFPLTQLTTTYNRQSWVLTGQGCQIWLALLLDNQL